MQIDIITDYETLGRQRQAWKELHAAADGGPFSSIEWIESWAEAFGGRPTPIGGRPRIACGWRDGQMIAALPLGSGSRNVTRYGPKVAGLGMLCAHRAGFHDFLAAPGHEDGAGALLSHVLANSHWALADLTPMRRSPAWQDAVQSIQSEGLVFRERDEITAAICDHAEGWDTYIASRSKSFRQALKKDARRQSAHDCVFEIVDNPGPEADRVLERVLDLSSRSWKARLGTDFKTDPRMSRFIRTLWHRLSPGGRMGLIVMEVDGADAGALISFDAGTTCYAFTVDFDERFARLSPGRTAVIEALRAAIRRGMLRSNLLRSTGFLPRLATRFETYGRLRICHRVGAVNALLTAQDVLRPIGKNLRKQRQLRTRKRRAFIDRGEQ